jgi:histidine triad (HIT) family protein
MASIFSRIIAGDIPSYRIAEDERFFAFLDAFPLVEGHVLVVPKQEIDKFTDMPQELLGQWLLFAAPIARAIEAAFPCNRCGMTVMGLEVPHAHMHLLPITTPEDMNFSRPKLQPDAAAQEATRQKLLAALG